MRAARYAGNPSGPSDFGVESFTVPAVLDRRAEQYPDRVMMSIAGTDVTFEQMRQRSCAAANMLTDLGVGRGDCVALFTATCPEWVYFWLGAARIGAVSAAVNAANKGDFLLHTLRLSRAKVILTDAERRPRIEEVAGRLDTVTDVVVQDDSLARPRSRAGPPGRARSSAPADDVGALFFTSGTTGPSKAVATTWHYLFSVAATVASAWEFAIGGGAVDGDAAVSPERRAERAGPDVDRRQRPCWRRPSIPARCGTTCVPTAPSASPVPGQWSRCCRTCPPIRATQAAAAIHLRRAHRRRTPTPRSKSATAVASSRCTG